jgi:dipeptidyl aminopeptidase/acylaminoacyl peptidase
VLHDWSFSDTVTQIQWSPDSSMILAALGKSGIAHVKNVSDDDWNCRIDEGTAGLSGIRWVPDSRHVITVSNFQLRLTIWSLTNKSSFYIKNPKFSGDRSLAFSPDKKYMALAERRDSNDYIGIYSCKEWKMVKQFQVETTDLADFIWTKDDHLIVWNSCVEVIVYLKLSITF